jgi:hypothetical protein
MTILDQWNHKWFGFWKEYGNRYILCPSIRQFVFPDIVSHYDKARLRQYLSRAQIVASTSRAAFPCPFSGKRIGGSISTRTDGEWYWVDDLPDYIDQFNVAIPTLWFRKIQANGYVPPPPIDMNEIEKLERPPLIL